MAVGNTFGATALSSYGGFWIGTAIILTPGGFEIVSAYEGTGFDDVFGFYLMVSATHLKHPTHLTDS
jgi:succinate-acetate transporter protein